jgi:hypothetical protein
MQTLIDYLRAQGAKKVEKLNQGNGCFLIVTKEDGSFTMPVGGKSQDVPLSKLNVLIAENGTAIATGRNVLEALEL